MGTLFEYIVRIIDNIWSKSTPLTSTMNEGKRVCVGRRGCGALWSYRGQEIGYCCGDTVHVGTCFSLSEREKHFFIFISEFTVRIRIRVRLMISCIFIKKKFRSGLGMSIGWSHKFVCVCVRVCVYVHRPVYSSLSLSSKSGQLK